MLYNYYKKKYPNEKWQRILISHIILEQSNPTWFLSFKFSVFIIFGNYSFLNPNRNLHRRIIFFFFFIIWNLELNFHILRKITGYRHRRLWSFFNPRSKRKLWMLIFKVCWGRQLQHITGYRSTFLPSSINTVFFFIVFWLWKHKLCILRRTSFRFNFFSDHEFRIAPQKTYILLRH